MHKRRFGTRVGKIMSALPLAIDQVGVDDYLDADFRLIRNYQNH